MVIEIQRIDATTFAFEYRVCWQMDRKQDDAGICIDVDTSLCCVPEQEDDYHICDAAFGTKIMTSGRGTSSRDACRIEIGNSIESDPEY